MDKLKLELFSERIKKIGLKTASALKSLLDESEKDSDPITGARGILYLLFDKGTFSECGTFVRRNSSDITDIEDPGFEGVITGWGAVNGQLVYAFAQDSSKCSGAVTEAHARKICELYRLAVQNGAPVVGFFNSAGAAISEGVKALAGYGRIMKAVSSASGVIPQIAVATGYATGASAVICGMFDLLITTPNGEVTVNPLSLIEGNSYADTPKNGNEAICAKDEADAVLTVKKLLMLLPSNNSEGSPTEISSDDINRTVSLKCYEDTGNAHELIRLISDEGAYTELYKDYAEEIITAITSIGGSSAFIVATNKSVNGGMISANGARKASRAVSLADSFNIPIVTLVDSCGYDRSADSESSPYLAELAKLAGAYAASCSPMITVIVGEAYGTAFTVLGSKSLGADLVLALDSAKVASMNASSAVAFLWNDKITGSVSRDDLEAEWNETVATPVEAASSGEIDDIIPDCELRQRIGAALYMLSSKSTITASRRHLIMPL